MLNIFIAIASALIGLLVATARFRYERAWQIKHEHYRDILAKLDEIQHYANDGAMMNYPVGAALSDLTETEINNLIRKNVGWLGRNLSATSLFIHPRASEVIKQYVSDAKMHHFNLAEDYGSWYSDQEGSVDEMAFDHEAFNEHTRLANEAAAEISHTAKRDLRGRNWRGLLPKNLLSRHNQ
ncbi:hypothetical protein [Billgrantia bachuensis]|uniref:Uncharacterized protein n=1 Tax=Billgrantia bachuensis TaxID=2717286 RepID=A0ABX0PSV1_9GAMM|nr:hypothetical protein [Halomonas bachuensis]NIC05282.1 hypothetical protein [Halomonas bachuensis]